MLDRGQYYPWYEFGSYVFLGKSILIKVKVLLLVWFRRQDAGESLVKYLLQLVASAHCVGLCFLAGFLQAHHLLHIHSQVRDGIAAGFLDVTYLRQMGCAVLSIMFFLSI